MTALEQFNIIESECGDDKERDPLERLRLFCSFAMQGQDWLDAEQFFDDVLAAQQKAESTTMNRYSPFYDPDTGLVGMSIDEKGSWVHINSLAAQQKAEPVARLHETDIYDFAGWLTTRPGVMPVGSSSDAAPMAEAVGEYIKTFPHKFAAQQKAEPAIKTLADLDWNRLAGKQRRALDPDHQWAFDLLYEPMKSALDPEGIRLLREARKWVNTPIPDWADTTIKQRDILLAAIDAYLAKYLVDQVRE